MPFDRAMMRLLILLGLLMLAGFDGPALFNGFFQGGSIAAFF